MRSPSNQLQQTLAELQLCTPEQLLACESQVRRLTRDLPDFDSCWLDVLVARRILTPWQSDCLLSPDPFVMLQGRYRLRDPLGDSTWLAETPDRQRLVVLRRLVGMTPEQTGQITSRAVDVVRSCLPFTRKDSSVCVPHEYVEHSTGEGGWFASPFVPGWRLDELLIRGGRLPWPVVAEIGRALLDAVQQLQRADLIHGGISPRNVRLQPSGRVTLVDPFSAPLLFPTVGFRADLRLRDVQFCAPERVGTGRIHDTVADLYSAGCVLWHLLTSRPTFLSADPVTFLMQMRERDVDDVRNWVPDCPTWMAHQIMALTRRSPELRPASAADAYAEWSAQSGRGVGRIRRMLSRLPDRATSSLVVPPSHPRRRSLLGAGAAAGIVGAVMLGLSSGMIPLPLQLKRQAIPLVTGSAATDSTLSESAGNTPTAYPVALPEISAEGVLTLVSGQSYHADTRTAPGTLQIQTNGSEPALVIVTARGPWSLKADHLRLKNVQVIGQSASAATLISASCRVFQVDQCVVSGSSESAGTPVLWQPSAEGSTIVRIKNTVVRGGLAAIRMRQCPDRTELENVLIDQARCAVRCDQVSLLQLKLTRVTQLGGRSFLDLTPESSRKPVRLELTAGDSVLTPMEGLVRLASNDPHWKSDRVQVAFRLPNSANPTVVLPSVNPVVYHDRSLGHMVALPDAQIVSESLLLATPKFATATPGAEHWSFARLQDFDGPKLGNELPGVVTSGLPAPFTTARRSGEEIPDVP